MTKRLTAISLFSGCGGMDLGFEKKGFDIVWALDHDYFSCETYRKNFGNKILNKDIVQVDFSTVPDCDIILGGFPCQDFSIIWKRVGINGLRGDLYRHFVRAIHAKRPKAFVAENVKGLCSANKGKALAQITSDFEKEGYKIYPNIINFADYGVPQMRERLIIVGLRNDIKEEFILPVKTHGSDCSKPHMSAGEALKNVHKVKTNAEHQKIAEKTKKMLEMIPQGGNFESVPKDSPFYVKGMISHVYRRLHKDKPAYTIIASGGGGTWSYHFSEPRPLTNRERARLQTFPDNFVFEGSISDVRKQIGNAVSPKGIMPIAKRLYDMLSESTVSNRTSTSVNEFDWLKKEKRIDNERRKLLIPNKIIKNLDLPSWRGIETFSPKEIENLLDSRPTNIKDLSRIIKEQYRFYLKYYGDNTSINQIMNQCEYNIHKAMTITEKNQK